MTFNRIQALVDSVELEANEDREPYTHANFDCRILQHGHQDEEGNEYCSPFRD